MVVSVLGVLVGDGGDRRYTENQASPGGDGCGVDGGEDGPWSLGGGEADAVARRQLLDEPAGVAWVQRRGDASGHS